MSGCYHQVGNQGVAPVRQRFKGHICWVSCLINLDNRDLAVDQFWGADHARAPRETVTSGSGSVSRASKPTQRLTDGAGTDCTSLMGSGPKRGRGWGR